MLGFLALVILLTGWRFTTLYFTRVTIFDIAPVDTAMAIHLTVNKRTIGPISELLGGVPLISNRSLTIDDILDDVSGDMAIFLTSNGDMSVAMRSDTKILDHFGITTQEFGPFLLISETLVPIKPLEYQKKLHFLPSIFSTSLGGLVFEDGIFAELSYKQGDFQVIFPHKKSSAPTQNTWVSSILHMSLIPYPTPHILTFFPNVGDFSEILVTEDGVLFLANGMESDLIGWLRDIEASNQPNLSERYMPDDSFYEEIRVDPELITVEEVNVAGNRALKAGNFVGIVQGDSLIIATSTALLEGYLSNNLEQEHCEDRSISIDPNALIDQVERTYMDPIFASIHLLRKFSNISLELNKYSNVLHLSRAMCG